MAARSRLAGIRRLFTGADDGWFPRVGGLGEGNGVAVGGGYRVATAEGTLTTRLMVSTRESYLLSADWHRRMDAQGRWSVHLSAAERRDAQQRFSGTGHSPDVTATGYALDTRSAEVRGGWHPAPWLTATLAIGAVAPSLSTSSDAHVRPVLGRYAPHQAAGVLTQPTFAVLRTGLTLDSREGARRQAGSRLDVEWRHYDDRANAGYTFDMWTVDAAHDIALGAPGRTLLLRAHGQQTAAASGHVPFYFQPTLGGGRSLRGYERQRFRDMSALLLQAEYEHRVHRHVAVAAFVDAGQVAPRLLDVRRATMRTDYGVGLRLGRVGGPILRTDVAFGGEARARLVVGFSTGF